MISQAPPRCFKDWFWGLLVKEIILVMSPLDDNLISLEQLASRPQKV